jgi:hypothetical protein
LSNESTNGFAGPIVPQHAPGFFSVHGELVTSDFGNLAVEDSPCRGPSRTATTRHQHSQLRSEREQPIEEILDRGGIRDEVVVVDYEKRALWPFREILGQ